MSDRVKELELEVELARARMQEAAHKLHEAKRLVYLEKTRLGLVTGSGSFVKEVREKIDFFKKREIKIVLTALCDSLDGTNSSALIDLDDKKGPI